MDRLADIEGPRQVHLLASPRQVAKLKRDSHLATETIVRNRSKRWRPASRSIPPGRGRARKGHEWTPSWRRRWSIAGKTPRESKAHEGSELRKRCNSRLVTTDWRLDKSPGGGAWRTGRELRRPKARQAKRQEGTAKWRAWLAGRQGKPLKCEPWTWLQS